MPDNRPDQIRIATRKSPLALWQAEFVKAMLQQVHPGLSILIRGMSTEGDTRKNVNLASIGGKGLFMKELELAILAGEADIAVHSMKDVPVNLPPGLTIAAACARAEPRDALVSNMFGSIDDLPDGSRLGTSSLRRKSQLRHACPTLDFVDLRGNVNTRLARLDAGDYDAIVLAAAGLMRLDMADRISEYIPVERCVPAIGQGIVGVECRTDDEAVIDLLKPIADEKTTCCLAAERSLNEALGGGCHVPVAGFAQLSNGHISLHGRVADPDGERLLISKATAPATDAEALGEQVAADLRDQGADSILRAVYSAGR